jgi:uncharacterized damage-inducible protein DinB
LSKLFDIPNLMNSPEVSAEWCAADTRIFIDANIAALKEGLALLNRLSDESYCADCQPAFRSTIGAHYRHLLEHYLCFLECARQGTVCYDSRARDAHLECKRQHAIETTTSIIQRLQELNEGNGSVTSGPREVPEAVSSGDDTHANEVFTQGLLINDQQSPQSVATTIQRELLFLQSHSVHHYAMVAAMCRILGIAVAENFGVAIATQVFEAEKNCVDLRDRASARGGDT